LPADCSECEERLEIDRPHLDDQNGALAHARCPDYYCGWSGDAEYCLIDLAEYNDEGRAHCLVPIDWSRPTRSTDGPQGTDRRRPDRSRRRTTRRANSLCSPPLCA
jgi:hypothetical protein